MDKCQIEHLLNQIKGYCKLKIIGGYISEYDKGDILIIESNYNKKYYPIEVAEVQVSLDESNIEYELEVYPFIVNEIPSEYKLYNQGVKKYFNNFWGMDMILEEGLDN